MTLLRFAGFELDEFRAELRGPDGAPIKLRPKPFSMLNMFLANAGRVVSKQELMQAVWQNVHVGEDSLFQCIREIRTVLGDDDRRLIRLVTGRGYLFDATTHMPKAILDREADKVVVGQPMPVEPALSGIVFLHGGAVVTADGVKEADAAWQGKRRTGHIHPVSSQRCPCVNPVSCPCVGPSPMFLGYRLLPAGFELRRRIPSFIMPAAGPSPCAAAANSPGVAA